MSHVRLYLELFKNSVLVFLDSLSREVRGREMAKALQCQVSHERREKGLREKVKKHLLVHDIVAIEYFTPLLCS